MANTETPTTSSSRPKISYWRKLGGGSLTISILVHAALLAVGVVWVLSVIPPEKPKVVDFTPSQGGGSPAKASQQKQSVMMKNLSSRISAKGVSTSFTLPEPEASSNMSALGSLGSGIGGLGGSGTGIGTGTGPGAGPGLGGLGTPGGSGNVFGMLKKDANALVGTFYDLKQDPKRKPTEITNGKTLEVIQEFVNKGWRQSLLDRDYFQAPQKLYQSKIYIPLMSADGAPAAFNCEKEVQPGKWVIVYRGTVTPAVSGKYRFVGAGDDVLVVRFNNKLMFDHGFYGGTSGTHLAGETIQILNGTTKNREREKILRESPMKIPVTFYKYPSTNNWNNAIGGIAVGPTFEANAGTPYPIDILMSEIPGGLFCSALMIEKVGEEYEKASTGSPILPVFQVDNALPAVAKAEAPPFATKAAPWKIVQGSRGGIDGME